MILLNYKNNILGWGKFFFLNCQLLFHSYFPCNQSLHKKILNGFIIWLCHGSLSSVSAQDSFITLYFRYLVYFQSFVNINNEVMKALPSKCFLSLQLFTQSNLKYDIMMPERLVFCELLILLVLSNLHYHPQCIQALLSSILNSTSHFRYY